MSGPKVVRIVTREELQAIGRGHLERTADAIQELVEASRRHGKYTAAMAAELAKRYDALNVLYQQDQWQELRSQSSSLAEFVIVESKRLRNEALAESKTRRQKRFRIRDAALSLISAYESSGRNPPSDLLKVAKEADSAEDAVMDTLQSILNVAFRDLNPAPPTSIPSEKQRELAALLGAGEKTETFAEWLAGRALESDRIQDPRLLSLLAEIEAFENRDSARLFLERAQAIAREDSESRRALLTDSLVLDLSSHCKAQSDLKALATNLREVRGSLTALGSASTQEMARRISLALGSLENENGKILLQEATAVLESESKALAAAARRRAVLEGLANLGYEVRESMSTAWVKNGRIVVGKPGATDYGVELGAPADASRMQVRLVGSDRPSSHRDSRRDLDMETLWCSEFQQLKARLAKAGTDVVIEKAVGIGVQAVKTVSENELAAGPRDIRAPNQGVRTLPGN